MIISATSIAQIIFFFPLFILFLFLSRKGSTLWRSIFLVYSFISSFLVFVSLTPNYGPDVFNVGGFFINTYMINTSNGYVVVDTGLPFNYHFFKWNLQLLGVRFDEIRYIVLTHSHNDHTGFLERLVKETPESTKVVLNKFTDDKLQHGENFKDPLFPNKYVMRLTRKIVRESNNSTFKGIQLPEERKIYFNGHQILKRDGIDLELLFLPGHTSDQIGVLTKDGRIFCGDMFMNSFLSTKIFPLIIGNLQEYKKSMNYILKAKVSSIFPSHGPPFPRQTIIDNIDYLDTHKLYSYSDT